jgi:hypothetical protein
LVAGEDQRAGSDHAWRRRLAGGPGRSGIGSCGKGGGKPPQSKALRAANEYHVLMTIRNGKISVVREYLDTQHVFATWFQR